MAFLLGLWLAVPRWIWAVEDYCFDMGLIVSERHCEGCAKHRMGGTTGRILKRDE